MIGRRSRPGDTGRTFRFLALLMVAAAMATTAPAHATANEGEPPHLQWAQRLVAELSPDRNAYASKPTYVVWNEDGNGPARNRSVCSSFVSHVLERAYGFGASEIRARFGTSNPQARDYYATIAAERGFARILQIDDARPGDIIAVRYPEGNRPTGHVMILDALPQRIEPSEPVVAHTTQYEARVLDSSHSFHGMQDTRYHGKHLPGGGAGRGSIRLYANTDGNIVGYAWSTRSISKYYDSSERQLAVGRFRSTYAGHAPGSASSGDDDERADSAL